VKPTERDFGTAHLVDDALEVLDESGVGVGSFLGTSAACFNASSVSCML
jgi:hypothetical protein